MILRNLKSEKGVSADSVYGAFCGYLLVGVASGHMTLTTVGYSDITPGSDAARGLSAAEAIVGQFYIAVLVAELIGKRVGSAAEFRSVLPPGVPSEDAAQAYPPAG